MQNREVKIIQKINNSNETYINIEGKTQLDRKIGFSYYKLKGERGIKAYMIFIIINYNFTDLIH